MKATRPVLDIFKKAGYFLDSPRIFLKNVADLNEIDVDLN
jgi:hypothetical protein